jgi:hypothetical protein
MHGVRRLAAILVASSLWLLGGCGIAPSGGMAERCANLMREADPGADIQITNSSAAATSITTIVAHADGVRRNLPANVNLPSHVAVECRFRGDILTGFRWTKGPS